MATLEMADLQPRLCQLWLSQVRSRQYPLTLPNARISLGITFQPLPTRRAYALITYLALEGATARGKLAELLWVNSDETRARGNLRRELNRLRHTPLHSYLETDAHQVRLGAATHCDATQFLASLSGDRLEAAIALYRGCFPCSLLILTGSDSECLVSTF